MSFPLLASAYEYTRCWLAESLTIYTVYCTVSIGRFFPSFKTCNCENRRPDTHLIVYPAALFSPHTTCTCQCDGVLAPTNVTGEEFGRLPPWALTG